MKLLPTHSLAVPLALVASLSAQERAPKRVWDHDEALRKVWNVLETEAAGQPWDDIKWRIDPAAAAEEAQETGRPILVYFFLQKDVGPEAAPC